MSSHAIHKLVLIDGHALAYRMFFALPVESFTTKKGEPTNATYGFIRTVLEWLLADNPPQYFAVSYDQGMTFRDELFAEYKGRRYKMPGDLDLQIEPSSPGAEGALWSSSNDMMRG